jgi:hypothetical protein
MARVLVIKRRQDPFLVKQCSIAPAAGYALSVDMAFQRGPCAYRRQRKFAHGGHAGNHIYRFLAYDAHAPVPAVIFKLDQPQFDLLPRMAWINCLENAVACKRVLFHKWPGPDGSSPHCPYPARKMRFVSG